MSDEPIQLRDQVGVLRRRWLVIVATVLACLALGVAYLSLATPTYVASAEVLLGAPSRSDGTTLTGEQVATEARAVTVADSVSEVIESLELDETPSDLVDTVTVEPDPSGASVLSITATRDDPAEAADIANGLAEQYLTADTDRLDARVQNLDAEITLIDERVLGLNEELGNATAPSETTALRSTIGVLNADRRALVAARTSLLLGSDSTSQNAEIVTPATPPDSASSPRFIPTLVLAGVLGLLLGLGLAYLRHYFDASVRDARDAAVATRRPVVGRIPHGARSIRTTPVTLSQPESRLGQAYRTLSATARYRLSQLTSSPGQRGRGRVVLVTSASKAEGKTQTAVNFAVAAASSGLDVVLVDADLRNSGVRSLLALPEGPGLSEILSNGSDLGARLHSALVTTDLDRLRVLRSGAAVPGPAELMAAPRWTSLLAGLCAAFDLVVIDSPAVLPVGDTLELVRSADLTLLVARGDVSRKDDLAAAVERIEQVGGTVGGVVVCDLSKAAMSASAPR
jgi:capsular exopolysaccharide synthesis family protein